MTTLKDKEGACWHIYQARNGAVYTVLGQNAVALTGSQIEKLCIDVYDLEDFDLKLYESYYQQQNDN